MTIDWANRIIDYGVRPASSFTSNPSNWRRHPDRQRQALHTSLSEVGWVAPVIENRRTGYLIDGHERIWQALQIGDDTPVPYIQVDLSEDEEALVLATLDPIAYMAQTDADMLRAILDDLNASALVQDNDALAALLNDVAEVTRINDAPVVPVPSDPPDPTLDSECFIEIYCSRADLADFESTLHEWGERPGVTVNVS